MSSQGRQDIASGLKRSRLRKEIDGKSSLCPAHHAAVGDEEESRVTHGVALSGERVGEIAFVGDVGVDDARSAEGEAGMECGV
jgi:hypothetical protein